MGNIRRMGSRICQKGKTVCLVRGDPQSNVQSMAWKHACSSPPESFALLRRIAKLWRLYSGMLRELYILTDYLEHGSTITGT